MRKRISTNLRWSRYIFLLIIITLISFLIKFLFLDSHFEDKPIMIMAFFLIICAILYYLLDNSKTVEFDSNFMYLSSKSGEFKIPLKDIYKIKLTMMEVNNRNLWKISYFDKNRFERSVRILPMYFNGNFEEFKNMVKQLNKDVKIKNWSHSFDIDQ